MPDRRQRARASSPRAKAGFSRDTDLTRRINIREERRSVLIVTNGERTEVHYFKALKEEPWVTADKVTVKFESGTPADAVRRAAVVCDNNAYDEAWAVCDLDEYDVSAAVAEAGAREIGLALSVPCFEVWLILHLSERCPGFNSAAHVSAYLEKLVPNWDKTALKFAAFRDGVRLAVHRAKRLGEPPEANPSTAVWRLVESLRSGKP